MILPMFKAKSFLFTVANKLFLNEVKHTKVVLKFMNKGHSDLTDLTPQFFLEEAEFKTRLERLFKNYLRDKERSF